MLGSEERVGKWDVYKYDKEKYSAQPKYCS